MPPPRRRSLQRRQHVMVLTAWILVVALLVGVLASLVFLNVR